MKAVAEKVSAARELARRLAEEKEAAVKTGKQYKYSDRSLMLPDILHVSVNGF